MYIFQNQKEINNFIKKAQLENKTIGFVPTMGVLHAGHLSLLQESKKTNDISIVSIFINPTQFNNQSDYENYPQNILEDIDLLLKYNCDVLFFPSKEDLYPSNEIKKHYDLGDIETILEGYYRPGHFQGVCQIIEKFLRLLQPHQLFLGEKDYQQCLVIQKLIEIEKIQTKIMIAPTFREENGLAMSSRNKRLSDEQKKIASLLFQCLKSIKQELNTHNLNELIADWKNKLQENKIQVEYIELMKFQQIENPISEKTVLLIAAYVGDVRLIDNLTIN